MDERWLPVIGYENIYEISSLGRVKRVTSCPGSASGRILRPFVGTCIYPRIGLSRDKKRQKHLIHRLVLAAFVGPCPAGMESCHNDGNVNNSSLENLRYDTPKNNYKDRLSHGNVVRGERHGKSKLTELQVLKIRESTDPITDLARLHGVTPPIIINIKKRRIWAWLD